MTDVAAWLRGLGLGRYEAAFRDNEIRPDVLPSLTAEDLKEIGVAAVGDRRRLLDAIAALRGPAPSSALATQSSHAGPPPAAPSPHGDAGTVGQGADGRGAERRLLTVLFCDMAGSTALAARLDPEDLREVMAAYHRAVTEAVRRQGGHVAKLLGDGVLAYFGWPRAHEDDAERAVRAGLAALEAVSLLEVHGVGKLAARVGIATGPVVVGEVLGEGEARERGVVGETPNLAARLQALADPGAVVADAATRRLTGRLFAWADLGESSLKGVPGPMHAWRALGESGVESRFEALRSGAAAPMVGREEELELLLRRWRRAASGEGQVVLLRGEAGIGKSRLVAALREALAGKEREELLFDCSPQHTDSALRPVVARLERAAGLVPTEAPEAQLAKLEALLTPLVPPAEDVALVAELLAVPTLGRWPVLDLSPQARRARLLGALVRRVRTLAARIPVLAVVEDAHWLDPSTRELLDMLVAGAADVSILLVVTHRPEFDASAWVGQPQVSLLQLSRLARTEHAALLRRVAGGKALPPEVEAEVAARTDGLPLFVEEVGRAVLESGALREEADRWVLEGPLPHLAVPASLQASLVARLDRLSSVREVAQAGAVIGRDFTYDLVAAVTSLLPARLDEALAQLEAAGLVRRRGAPPEATYTFKHALLQDAAYSTLLRERRRELHAAVARIVEGRSPEVADVSPHVLAHHLEEAGDILRAISFRLKAAERAICRSALVEALSEIGKARARIAALADTAERWRVELDLELAAGKTLAALKGYSAPETGAAYERALDLCRRLRDDARLAGALYGAWIHSLMRAEYRQAVALAEEMLVLGEGRRGLGERAEGHRARGISLMFLGRLVEARDEMERALSLYDAQAEYPNSLSAASVVNGRIALLGYLAHALFYLGDSEAADGAIRRAVREAETLGQPYSLTMACSQGCRLAALQRRPDRARAGAERLLPQARDQGFALFVATGVAFRGWAMAQEGDPEQGLSQLAEGIGRFRALGAVSYLPLFLALQAECLGGAGDAGRGLALAAEGLELVERTEERVCEAELHRIHGQLLARTGDAAAAEGALGLAIAAARRSGARTWELRAATGLARLWRDQGQHREARALLAPVYASFTEGFGFPDLVEARALLEELEAPPADGVERREEETRAPVGSDRLRESVPDR